MPPLTPAQAQSIYRKVRMVGPGFDMPDDLVMLDSGTPIAAGGTFNSSINISNKGTVVSMTGIVIDPTQGSAVNQRSMRDMIGVQLSYDNIQYTKGLYVPFNAIVGDARSPGRFTFDVEQREQLTYSFINYNTASALRVQLLIGLRLARS